MGQEPFSSILSQPLSMRSEPEPTDSSSTQSSSSPERKTPPTTSPVVTTPSVRRSLTSASTESESSPISALASKVSSSSTPSEVVPDLVLDPSSSRDFLSTMERSPSSDSPSTHPHRSPPLSSSHTTLCSPPTPSLSTPMSPSCLTTRQSTISAEETSTLSAQPTPTSTESSLRSSLPSLPPSDSMVPSTSISLSSRPTWCHTHVSISCFPPTPQSSPLRRHTTNSSLLPRSPTPPSSQPP